MLRDWFRRDVEYPLARLVGGPARLKVIALLASVLGLDSADKATVGAVAAQLEKALHIGNVEVGLLVSASTAVGAILTLPFGILADRVKRTRVLVWAILAWSLTMVLSGAAGSYTLLLISRLLLGCIVASASPLVASLTGDFFRPGERGRIFGYIIAGELVGVAVGFLICGNLAAWYSWRVSFWSLAALGLLLAGVIWKFLPEPARGGYSYVPEGAEEVPSENDIDASQPPPQARREDETVCEESDIDEQWKRCHVTPHSDQILHDDPTSMSLWQAVRHVLSVRTYRTLILASALGYFYFTGLRTFAIVYMRRQFDLGQAMASTLSVGIGLGAVVGVLLVGRLGDALIRRGTLTGRIWTGGLAYLLATAALLLGLVCHSLLLAAPLLFLAAAGLGGANPAVDAARLDVMHSALWGRAEGVRATLRFALEAGAPPLFGYLAGKFSHGDGMLQDASRAVTKGSNDATGLQMAFLVMLVPLLVAGLIMLLRTRRTYPRDVVTTITSEHASRDPKL
ncbi:MFS transporter [Oleiagrimonas sp. C23AA]|uniref:MFS transporter n=1 Tax=Oleiagrimonas sp. C23AA TaxID=2719047 RepID=UPI00141F70EB|nr:MFS transporter [Oleiagrimonas sp. C23AA]NII09875.1 MFS transporter [Oleiagrimonas sp. C23AA]